MLIAAIQNIPHASESLSDMSGMPLFRFRRPRQELLSRAAILWQSPGRAFHLCHGCIQTKAGFPEPHETDQN
jgi:hypothetical protein